MALFNFKNLINKFSISPVYLISYEDSYIDYDNGGVEVKGREIKEQLEPAAVMDKNIVSYGEGGAFEGKSTKLYCYRKLEIENRIEYKGVTYSVKDILDYSDFDEGLYIYMLEVSK